MSKLNPKLESPLSRPAIRPMVWLISLFSIVIIIFLFGRYFFDIDEVRLLAWFQGVRGTIWALPVTIITFTVLAFFGVPQWALITGSVIAFGPVLGASYAWCATLISASLNFWLARYLGADRLEKVRRPLIAKIAGLVRKNGFFTSLTVRLVPTGPFILVNMAAGLSNMWFPAFLAGTALGIIPKIAAIALTGHSLVETLKGSNGMVILIPSGFAVLAIFLMFYGRAQLLKRLSGESE